MFYEQVVYIAICCDAERQGAYKEQVMIPALY